MQEHAENLVDGNLNHLHLLFADTAFYECYECHTQIPPPENTRRIVQNIDVLWLTRNVIHRAFEVESTTSIYSGLLRLNDLVLAQPNNQIRLFIVAPSGRREKVFNQLIRPSFHALADQCEFLSFEMVDDAVGRIESLKGGQSVRVSGLLEGERFQFQEHYIYPTGV